MMMSRFFAVMMLWSSAEAFVMVKPQVQPLALQSLTRSILEGLEERDAAQGAGASGTYAGLQGLDKAWRKMRDGPPAAPPVFVREVDAFSPDEDYASFDCVVLGGTLGIFFAAALQKRGLKCAVVERGLIKGRQQEWNLSLDEVMDLVEAGVLSKEDVDGAVEEPGFKEVAKGDEGTLVASHFGSVRAGFNSEDDELQEIWMPRVLNIGVRPEVAVARAKENFEKLGGVVYEKTACQGIEVTSSLGTSVILDDKELRCKLVIDAMGNGSPVARQSRAMLNGGLEPRPSGICCVVGTLATGFDLDNSFGDLIFTNEDSRSDRQYFWEAFPAASVSDSARTTYLFTYLSVDEAKHHSVEGQFDDYFQLLPKYQRTNHPGLSQKGVLNDDFQVQRALYGLFPTYRATSPLKSTFNNVLSVGDASGVQSPLSFGGFGALTRHAGRVADAVSDAVQSDALKKEDLSLINPYMPNLAATWMFQKAFVVPASRPPEFINRLMRLNYRNMRDLGDDVLRPFNQDVTQPMGLLKVLGLATIRDPANIPNLIRYVGIFELADWLRHFFNMFAYDTAHKLFGQRLRDKADDLFATFEDADFHNNNNNKKPRSPDEEKEVLLLRQDTLKLAFKLRRLADAWEYGSGNDYGHHH